MAGDKSLDIYALQEAEKNYRHALKDLRRPRCLREFRVGLSRNGRLLEAFVLGGDYRD